MFAAFELQQMRQQPLPAFTQIPRWHFRCNPHVRRHLVNGIVGWGRPAIAALVVPIAFFALHRVTPTHSYLPSAHPAAAITHPSASHHAETDWPMPPLEDDDDVVVDLTGNEVTPAVATYTIDASGSPYEVHSPQTELPRLGSPKS